MNKIITPRDGWRYFTQRYVIMGIMTAVLAGMAITKCLTMGTFDAVDAVTFGCIALLCSIHQFNLGYVELSLNMLKKLVDKQRLYVSIGVIFNVKSDRIEYFYWRCYESNICFSKVLGSIDKDELEKRISDSVDNVDDYESAEINMNCLYKSDKEYELVRQFVGKTFLVRLNETVAIDNIPFMDDTECWLIQGLHDEQVD